jgi:hypothetical protein
MKRAAATRTCSCGRENVLLMPIAACGAETIWDARCPRCGSFAWFDARADADFRRALAEGRERGPAEVDRLFAAALPFCACGGAWRVVREIEKEPCLACGVALGPGPLAEHAPVDVPPLRSDANAGGQS